MKLIPLAYLIILVIPITAESELDYSWEELVIPERQKHLNPEREYAVVDLNLDGKSELIISRSFSLVGTGGLIYDLYLGLKDNQFRHLDTFLAGSLRIEDTNSGRRLWTTSHLSSQEVRLECRWISKDFKLSIQGPIDIKAGDGGTMLGNQLMKALLDAGDPLIFKSIK